jgi:hypothetical protein
MITEIAGRGVAGTSPTGLKGGMLGIPDPDPAS